jgi:hypothetical protein
MILIWILEVFSESIWETARSISSVPLLNMSSLATNEFRAPFMFRNSFDYNVSDQHLHKLIGSYYASSIEQSLLEDRTVPAYHDWTFSAFLALYKYTAIYLTSQMPPPLRSLLPLPGFIGMGRFFLSTPMLWLANGRTQSVLHRDSDSNIHCVLDGQKSLMLWHKDAPIDSEPYGWVDAAIDSEQHGHKGGYGEWAAIDLDDLSEEYLSSYRQLDAFVAMVKKGQCVYIPAGWFHVVTSDQGRTLSYHVWFKNVHHSSDDKYRATTKNMTLGDCAYKDDWYQEQKFDEKLRAVSSWCNRTV